MDQPPPSSRPYGALALIILPLLLATAFLIVNRTAPVVPVPLGPTPSLEPPQVNQRLLEHGKELYELHCVACHGADGKGKGPAAYLLYPKPRNLSARAYRLTRTLDGSVAVEDVYRTISQGMPGTAMPAYDVLADEERWALAYYVKSFLKPDAHPPQPLQLSEAPPLSELSQQRGRQLFLQACATCHGSTGRGDGPQEQLDTDGYRNRPRDLTRGVFKGGRDSAQLFARIAAGLPGSSMPAHHLALKPREIWSVVEYIQTLSDPAAQERQQQRSQTLVASRAEVDLSAPEAAGWQSVKALALPLMATWLREDRPEQISVAAAQDGRQLFLRLSWKDSTLNPARTQDSGFCDAAAVQWAEGTLPPPLSMGHKLQEVEIWQCRITCPAPQPDRSVFAGGAALGNPVALLQKCEKLKARGFGAVAASTPFDLKASSVRGQGEHSVVFVHPLGKGSLPAASGTYFVAFALWDGAHADRGGQKSVTVWHRLTIEP